MAFYLIATSMAKFINAVEGKPLLEIYDRRPDGEEKEGDGK